MDKKKTVMLLALVVGCIVGTIAGGQRVGKVQAQVEIDTSCPAASVEVKFRGGRSSYADVQACGNNYVYYCGFFGSPKRM
jgi:hypothetical protein